MTEPLAPDQIKQIAMAFDQAIESLDLESALSYFADDCRIELLGIVLSGQDGARKWLQWLFGNLAQIKFEPVTIMVQDGVFFEEFVIQARLDDGRQVRSKQSEVLVYEKDKIKSLRLYFDRLDFADLVARGFVSRTIVRRLIKASLKGLA
ncbi:MAG: nuclear transport factor 2 family protein [Deltaproteobacteria bacterium]|nr:nuclear transport factor 2 family protein [Deltaproteobacteria bacterium]